MDVKRDVMEGVERVRWRGEGRESVRRDNMFQEGVVTRLRFDGGWGKGK